MEYDQEKIDQVTLALLYLMTFDDEYGRRAWKGFDWDTMNRLHEKGYISNPKREGKICHNHQGRRETLGGAV